MKKNKVTFIIIIILQILILLGIILFKTSTLTSGTEVFLRIEPVDPKDLLRGDFVTFKFSDLSEIKLYKGNDEFVKQEDLNYSEGEIVYVPLEKIDNEKYVKGIGNPLKEKPRNSRVFLRGAVEEIFEKQEANCIPLPGNYCEEEDKRILNLDYLDVKYGIEDYFIPEGKGSDLDFSKGNNYAWVIVDADGNAVLKEIYLDGKQL